MAEITDDKIKKKHKEFDGRIQATLLEIRGSSQKSLIGRLLEAARMKRAPRV